MLYIIGLGLADERDITVKGLDAVKKCDKVYLEAYTSILGIDVDRLQEFYGKPVITADRDLVEQDESTILQDAKTQDVAFLVVGDPFGATTHADLILRAKELSIDVQVIHNASIMNAVGCTGLALYNFGQTVSIPFFTETWKPDSWFPRILENWKLGLHTLCLLDIKVKEQSEENMARGRKIYEPARYMSSAVAVQQMIQVWPEGADDKFRADRILAISLARVGSIGQTLVGASVSELAQASDKVLGEPLHSLIIIGNRFHPLEVDFTKAFALDAVKWTQHAAAFS